MYPLARLYRSVFRGSRLETANGDRRSWRARAAKSVKLRWALGVTAVALIVVIACTARAQDSTPDSQTSAVMQTASPTPKRTPKPTPFPTPVPTPVPTPPPPPTETAPPAQPAHAPAPAAQQIRTSAPAPLPGTGPNYYVDHVNGNDANSGTSEGSAWRSLEKASDFTLSPGARLLLMRGGVWTGSLKIEESGAGGLPVVVASYGDGPLPIIQGGSDCIQLSGSAIFVTQIQAQDCWAGVGIQEGASFNRVEGNALIGNIAGVHVSEGASDNVIAGNTLVNNNKMSVNDPGGGGDSGAFGVLLNGDRNEVAYNHISGSDAHSYDYGRDGAAVEIYKGQGNHIHHNTAVDNHAFSELGNPRSRDNTFAYNLVLSSLPDSSFLVTRGGESGYGPVLNTRLYNNTVYMTGPGTQGFVCHGGCNAGVLTMRNNIIHAVAKAGYADNAFDEDYNLYSGGITQFPLGPNSAAGNPMFINPGGGDFRLAPGSPAVDSGVDAGYGADLDGRPVPLDGNGDGVPIPDRGAFER
jgi:parallel beta-helix repeat protein